MEKSTGAIVGLVFLKFVAGTAGIIVGIMLVCLVLSIIGGIIWYIKNKLHSRKMRKEAERLEKELQARRLSERDER